MQKVVPIKGSTKYTIILDPSVWIFDKRKIDLDQFIQSGEYVEVAEREASGSYGIPFRPFLENAAPLEDAKHVKFILEEGHSVQIPLEEALNGILGFSDNGKPLSSTGPLHFYFGDPDHAKEPVRQICAFEVTT